MTSPVALCLMHEINTCQHPGEVQWVKLESYTPYTRP